MKTALLAVLVAVAVVTVDADDDLTYTPCAPGTTRDQDCNTCTCLASGIGYSCTRMACLPRTKRDLTANDLAVTPCTAGSTQTLDCNTCTCAANGSGYRCTRLTCPTHDRKKRDLATQPCTPGERIKEDCNTCTCGVRGDGYQCTRMACPPSDARKKRDEGTGTVGIGIGTQPVEDRHAHHCTPGTTFKRDCNTCVCGETGIAACTQIFCLNGR